MTIFVTGAAGMVGSHLVGQLKNQSDLTILTPTVDELNITNEKAVTDFFAAHNPDVVVHFAAFTDVARAEEQRGDKSASCWQINVVGTKNLAQICRNQAYLIYISTDMVFSGKKADPGPYIETHPIELDANLLSWYGWTKAEGERQVQSLTDNFAILRFSNPTRAHYSLKLDHVRKILDLYDKGTLHPFFDDQYLSLSFVDEITTTIQKLLISREAGIFHASSYDLYTPFELAQYLLKVARNVENVVERTSIVDFLASQNDSNRYMQYGGLNVSETQNKLEIQFSPWKKIIDQLIIQIGKENH